MSTLAVSLFSELEARQPRLTAMAVIFLLALLPPGLASLIDDQLVNGVNVWSKPMKFLASLAIYYGSLAWLHGYLPEAVKSSRMGRAIVPVPVAVGILEMTWLVVAAALGEPSHFNRSSPAWAISYGLAGIGATMLMLCASLISGRCTRCKYCRSWDGS